jgi:hypothetical protein
MTLLTYLICWKMCSIYPPILAPTLLTVTVADWVSNPCANCHRKSTQLQSISTSTKGATGLIKNFFYIYQVALAACRKLVKIHENSGKCFYTACVMYVHSPLYNVRQLQYICLWVCCKLVPMTISPLKRAKPLLTLGVHTSTKANWKALPN